MALRQINVIDLSLTHFRFTTFGVDVAYKFPVLILSVKLESVSFIHLMTPGSPTLN
jgi:hypothetical protein